jgi:hypothetical protein
MTFTAKRAKENTELYENSVVVYGYIAYSQSLSGGAKLLGKEVRMGS